MDGSWIGGFGPGFGLCVVDGERLWKAWRVLV